MKKTDTSSSERKTAFGLDDLRRVPGRGLTTTDELKAVTGGARKNNEDSIGG